MAVKEESPAAAPASKPVRTNVTDPTWWPWILGGWIFVLLLWLIPHFETGGLDLTPTNRLLLETQIRDTWAKILWAAVTLAGASVVWRHLNHLSNVVENSSKTLAAAERNAFFLAQAAATERYARAMSLLADSKMEVRLGAIYALERLARESEKDHAPIMEVLAAVVREHASWQEGEPVPARPPADIQAILTVLGRRHAAFDPEEMRIDLHAVALARAYLPWANFDGAFLYESNLEGALLQNASFKGAWLWKANFKDAVLDGAHMEGADLTGAAYLTTEQLKTVFLDPTTKLPDHLRNSVDTWSETPEIPEVTAEDYKLPSVR